MHYSNGRAARVGDLVRGKGYNVKHEVIGILVAAFPDSTACNCQVSCVAVGNYGPILVREVFVDKAGRFIEGVLAAKTSIEYGQLDAFVALDPSTGEVLLPEEK